MATTEVAAVEVITITDVAAEKVREYIAKQGNQIKGLRVSVSPGGCAGFTYGLSLAKGLGESEEIVHANGVEIYLDRGAVQLLQGANLDYVDGLQGAGFVLNNPNAKSTCGCGKSFC